MMYSKSENSLLGNFMEPPPPVVNPAVQMMPQPVQLVPVIYPTAGVPVVVNQVPRRPVTVLPQPLTATHVPPEVASHAVSQSSYISNAHVQDSLNAARTTDAMQIFAERAEKSGIKLEAIPETSTHNKSGKQAAVGRSFSVDASRFSHATGPAVSYAPVSKHPFLNISSPEFVPRSSLESQNSVSPPVTTVNGRFARVASNAYSAGDVPVYSTTRDVFLPQHFANMAFVQTQHPPAFTNTAHRHRDASTQTAKVNFANACIGNSSVRVVDASTNTSSYDATEGLQRVQVGATAAAMQSDHATKQNVSDPVTRDSSVDAVGIDHRLENRSSTPNRWAENCWRQGQSPGCAENDKKYTGNVLFTDANKNPLPSATKFASSSITTHKSASSSITTHKSSNLHFEKGHDAVPKSSFNVHQTHSSSECECSFSNCPFALPTMPSSVNTSDTQEQHAAASSSLFAARNESGHETNENLASCVSHGEFEDEKLADDEDLCEEVYYSDEDDDNLLPSAANPQPTEIDKDHSALLAAVTSGGLPSQATIELAVAQLMDALTADEKQLMASLVQQMALMNPVLYAANPLALQVEAIRIILTTRGQRALALGMSAVQQMASQAQLQNMSHNDGSPDMAAAAVQPVIAEAESFSVPADIVSHHQDVPSQAQVLGSGCEHHNSANESQYWVSEPKYEDSGTLDIDQRYHDARSTASSDHAQLGASARVAKGRGRGIFATGGQYDNETCRQDRPRGRGFGRGKSGNTAADETHLLPGNSSASGRQPLVPPPLHTAKPDRQADSKSKSAVNNSEDWEDEIDEFGSSVFQVESSFFKSGKR